MQRLEQVVEIVKGKLIGNQTTIAGYEEHKQLIEAAVRTTLESLGQSGIVLGSDGQLYSANRERPRDDRGAHWAGGKKKR